jgi:hypothetical protein
MNRMVLCAIACGIAALSSTIHAAQPGAEVPAAQPVMTNEACAAAAAVNHARCFKPAHAAADQSRGECEDAVNMRRRVCMIEVLEALHPGFGRTPAGRN